MKLKILIAVLLTISALGAVVIWQNSYDIREEKVSVHGLDGVLALPDSGDGPFGLVVFVHGDGEIDATHDGFYRPMWESFARAGYASLSWDKPVGWLDQSMDDRADEVRHAIAWARQRPDIDAKRIGLWGASQAGWVMPKVASTDPSLRFMIAVSTAINWLQQGRYNLLAQMRADGATQSEMDEALQRRERRITLLRQGAPVPEDEDITPQRWAFILKNFTSDATADLKAMHGIPVLLILAGHDLNVDVADAEAAYRRLVPNLTVQHYPDGTHSLLKQDIEESTPRLTVTAIFAPRMLFADGFLANQQQYLQRVNR
ncbi:alpha/beta hydrolase [Dactylosporangium roseum]|uniref:Alpha/beta hydrolase n=1 Tax=Dactylosporangium roseum TaxID=47989 RepID=A0ABY5YZU6_9ACTN|nr:alpha/beta hydrolase [Dactylosporangium roseum]UWZ35057.1 alpha/beta hydrolase [Dactylosporangium roseum]